MSLHDEQELNAARQKLGLLEAGYLSAQRDTIGGPHIRELELRSLKQLMNQLHEEIARVARAGRSANQSTCGLRRVPRELSRLPEGATGLGDVGLAVVRRWRSRRSRGPVSHGCRRSGACGPRQRRSRTRGYSATARVADLTRAGAIAEILVVSRRPT